MQTGGQQIEKHTDDHISNNEIVADRTWKGISLLASFEVEMARLKTERSTQPRHPGPD